MPAVVADTVGVTVALAVLPVVVAMPKPLQVYDAVPAPPVGVAVNVSLPPVQMEDADAPTVTPG